ncbi:MAG: hypothetical protein JXR97_08075, partial [Planctomycetes bacterium]|nr:hypothetical protein [Planctomycetota bacterium]
VSCTGAPHAVIFPETIGERNGKPLLIADLAVPRDVAPEVASIPGIEIMDMDSIAEICQRNMDARERARNATLPLMEHEAGQLWKCLNAAMSERCLADWRVMAHDALESEQARLFSECPEMPEEYRQKLEEMGHRLLHRLLTWPMKAMACAMSEGLPCADIFPELDDGSDLEDEESDKEAS